jgi:hypothetical protein
MILLLLYGLYNSMPYTIEFSEPIFSIFVRVVWAINFVASYSKSMPALIFTVTRNRNDITTVSTSIFRLDKKLLHYYWKEKAYRQQKSHITKQLKITFILFAIVSAPCSYSFYDHTCIWFMYVISQILSTVTNNVKTLQYVNMVLKEKQR